jgi:hypothetical protein
MFTLSEIANVARLLLSVPDRTIKTVEDEE